MKEFITNNFGYIIGILLTPITWNIFKICRRKEKIKMEENMKSENMKKIALQTLEQCVKQNFSVNEIYQLASYLSEEANRYPLRLN